MSRGALAFLVLAASCTPLLAQGVGRLQDGFIQANTAVSILVSTTGNAI